MASDVVVSSVVVVLKTVSLLIGGAITYFGIKAARRTGRRPFYLLGIGFGLITVGALVAGIIDQLLRFERDAALAIESGFTTAGLLTVLYSLVMEETL